MSSTPVGELSAAGALETGAGALDLTDGVAVPAQAVPTVNLHQCPHSGTHRARLLAL
jgi:hypothetical protein